MSAGTVCPQCGHLDPLRPRSSQEQADEIARLKAERENGRWLVFNIGCIECGVSSNVVGRYASKEVADQIADRLGKLLDWREGGQNGFEVFDLEAPQSDEYAAALAKVQP